MRRDGCWRQQVLGIMLGRVGRAYLGRQKGSDQHERTPPPRCVSVPECAFGRVRAAGRRMGIAPFYLTWVNVG